MHREEKKFLNNLAVTILVLIFCTLWRWMASEEPARSSLSLTNKSSNEIRGRKVQWLSRTEDWTEAVWGYLHPIWDRIQQRKRLWPLWWPQRMMHSTECACSCFRPRSSSAMDYEAIAVSTKRPLVQEVKVVPLQLSTDILWKRSVWLSNFKRIWT